MEQYRKYNKPYKKTYKAKPRYDLIITIFITLFIFGLVIGNMLRYNEVERYKLQIEYQERIIKELNKE